MHLTGNDAARYHPCPRELTVSWADGGTQGQMQSKGMSARPEGKPQGEGGTPERHLTTAGGARNCPGETDISAASPPHDKGTAITQVD